VKRLSVVVSLLVPMAGITCATAVAAPVKLADGTPVNLRLMQTLKSGAVDVGAPVALECADTVLAPEGGVLIANKAQASGQVTASQKPSYFGQPGKLDFTIVNVKTADGKLVPLRFSMGERGKDKMWDTIALMYFVSGWFFFLKGEAVVYPQGMELVTYVDAPEGVMVEPGPPLVPNLAPIRVTGGVVLESGKGDNRTALAGLIAENPNAEVGLCNVHIAVTAAYGDALMVGGNNASKQVLNPEQTIYSFPPGEKRLFVKPVKLKGASDRCIVHIAQPWVTWSGQPPEPKCTVVSASKDEEKARVNVEVRNDSTSSIGIEVAAALSDGGKTVGLAWAYVGNVAPGKSSKVSMRVAGQCTGELATSASAGPVPKGK